MFISQKHLDRRTLLRGAGIALGLPLLDAMVPAMAAERKTAAAPVRRLGFVIYPLGVDQDRWKPKNPGDNWQTSEALTPLEPFRKKFVVITGLSSDPDRTKAGFHDRALASFLTGVEMTKGKVQVGVSVDQLAAQTLGKETPFASLEISTENFGGGAGHIGPVFKTATTPLPFEYNPRRLFERLFGEGGKIDPAASAARDAADRSSLDAVTERITELKNRLGAGDRRKLEEYLESIRDVERRIQVASQKRPVDLPEMNRPAGVPIAFASDTTRVFAFKLGRDASNRVYPESGYKAAFHSASHHQDRDDRITDYAKINKYHVSLLPYFLEKLKNTKEGDSNLLENTLVIYGSPMGNSNVHNHKRCPLIFAGHAGGALKGGVHVKGADGTPMANALLTAAHAVGLSDLKTLGDSTATLDLNSAPESTVQAAE